MPLGKRYRVLVVDDDENIRKLCQRNFEALDVCCDPASDPVAAEGHLRAHSYDAVVTDLRMPKKHGHEFATELRSNGFTGLIFVVTGVNEPRLATDLIGRGVTDIATKPVDYKFFCAKVLAMLERGDVGESPNAANADSVEARLERTSEGLRSQLSEITESFETTIANLEKQRRQIEAGYVGSVRLLTDILSLFSQSEGSHSRRVEDLTIQFASALGVDRAEVLNLRVAALVHEIGLFGLSDKLRNTPSARLSASERDEYQKYPEIGARLLSEVDGAGAVAEIVLFHCENYDGSGFPQGLRKDAIPFGARLLRIADAIDTHLMNDPGADSLEGVTELLTPGKGKKFDPGLVDASLSILADMYAERVTENTETKPIADLRSGLTVAESVFDRHGRCLVREGTRLSETMVARVRADAIGKTVRIRVEST